MCYVYPTLLRTQPPQGFTRSTTKYWVRNEDVSTVKHHVLQHLPVFQFDKNNFAGDAQVRLTCGCLYERSLSKCVCLTSMRVGLRRGGGGGRFECKCAPVMQPRSQLAGQQLDLKLYPNCVNLFPNP